MEEDKRKMYSNAKFQMEYRRNGDDWEYTVDMPHGVSKTFKFRIGEPYDSTTLDGRPILVSTSLPMSVAYNEPRAAEDSSPRAPALGEGWQVRLPDCCGPQ